MLARGGRWFGLLALAAPACGGGAPFTPTTPVAGVCSMLALADVQVLLPGAPAGTEQAGNDGADVWIRSCAWQAGNPGLILEVEGALTSKGNQELNREADANGGGYTSAAVVSGVGDEALYLARDSDQHLIAKQGSEVVSVGAYLFPLAVPPSSLQPLATEALANLESQ
jgi:hypothetical protein